MSYQYSSSPHNSAAMDMQHSAYMSSYPPSTSSNMEGRNEPDTDSLGLHGEKKRNRLGYARTNMACGNCRKRKIRCEAVKNDTRCAVCLRLGKDCQFYAVDQQPPPPPSGVRSGPRPLSRTTLASAATSPPIAPGHPGDMQAQQSFHDRTIPLRPGAPGGRQYSYGQGMGWEPTDTSPSTVKHEGINASWRGYPPESPVAPGFAPYPVPVPQTSATWATSPLETTVGPEGSSRPEDVWSPYQQPTRSMSFNGEHSVQYATTPGRSFERKASVASDMYHATSMEAMPTTSYAAWQQPYQPWYAEGGQPASSSAENPSHIDGMYYGR